jgi:hypothetical protein
MLTDHKRSQSLSIQIHPPSPKRQRTAPPSPLIPQQPPELAEENDTAPDSTTTKPETQTPESTSPAPSERRRHHSVKQIEPRLITTDVIVPLQEPFKVQTVCQGYQKGKQKDFPLCLACIGRQQQNGACKFAYLRAFPPDDITGQFLSSSFMNPMFLDSAPFLRRNQREATRDITITYSTTGSPEDIEFIKSCIAPTLSAVLGVELANEMAFRGRGLLRRRREAGVRPICDGCATTIFSGHFMCCCCGREICLDCFAEWDDGQDKGWERVDSCSKKRRHTKRQMVPFTFFQEGELEALVKDVNDFVPKESGKTEDQEEKFQRGQSEGFLPFIKTSVKAITEENFKELWGLGQPIVLTDCLKRFKVSWTPNYFIKKYRNVGCLLVNCLSDKTLQSTVGKFFQQFLSPDTKQPLKLKVPPPLHHA